MADMIECPDCEGEGEVPVYYHQTSCSMSNEEAMRRAGQVSHYETCPTCKGECEVADED